MIIHEDFDFSEETFDIALVKLNSSLNLTKHTPACLPDMASTFVGRTAWVYGWGAVSNASYFEQEYAVNEDDYEYPELLTETTQTVVTNERCANFYPNRDIAPNHLCAHNLGHDICTGDNGAPLTLEENGKHTLIGVALLGGKTCARVSFF